MTPLGNTWVFPQTVSSWKCCIRRWISAAVLSLQVFRCTAEEQRSQRKVNCSRLHFFIRVCHGFSLLGAKTPKRRWGSMVTTVQHASPGYRGAVSGRNQKRGNRNESTEELTVCFHTHIITQSLPPPLTDLRLPLTDTLLSLSVPLLLQISSISPQLQLLHEITFSLLTLSASYNPSFMPHTFLSLFTCSLVFLVFFVSSLPRCLSACQDMHRRRAERGEERGRTRSTADRWEGLPGVKVQSQGKVSIF